MGEIFRGTPAIHLRGAEAMEHLRCQLSTGHKWQLSSRVMAIEAASNLPPRMRNAINGNMCNAPVEVEMLWDAVEPLV